MKPTSLRPKDKQAITIEQIDEKMKRLNDRKGLHTKILAQIAKIREGIDSPIWAHVSEKCQEIINGADAIEDQADEYKPDAHPIPDRVIWKASGFRKAANAILAVGKMIRNEEGYRESLLKIEKEIKDLGQRKSALGG